MQTVDIIESVVDLIELEITINSQVTTDGVIQLFICDTKWISKDCTLEIDGKKYLVVEFLINEWLKVKPEIDTDIIEVEKFSLRKPSYIHATYKMAKNEVNAEYNKEEYLPAIYLHEMIRDRKVNDDESMIDRESELNLYFLEQANTTDWLTNDHYREVIEPMNQMVQAFMGVIKKSNMFTDVFNYECFNHVNISLNSAKLKSMFDCDLTGIQVKLFSEIRKNLSCPNNKCLN